jgi:hypothetical protein
MKEREMGMFKTRKTVSVEAVDGGWVLDWDDPSKDDDDNHSHSYRIRTPTSGREIFTDRKKLLKRIDALV